MNGEAAEELEAPPPGLPYSGRRNSRFGKKGCTLIDQQSRHVAAVGGRTSIRLESQFWAQIDKLARGAGCSWREWAADVAATKPEGANLSSWVRVKCLEQTANGDHHEA